jgi:hypothetical protein
MSMGLRPDVGCNHWPQARALSSSPADRARDEKFRARSQKQSGPVVGAARAPVIESKRSQDGATVWDSGSTRAKGVVERRPASRVAFLLVGSFVDERIEV